MLPLAMFPNYKFIPSAIGEGENVGKRSISNVLFISLWAAFPSPLVASPKTVTYTQHARGFGSLSQVFSSTAAGGFLPFVLTLMAARM